MDIKLSLKTYQQLNGEVQLGKPISFYTSLKDVIREGVDVVDIENTGFKETTFIKFFIPEKRQKNNTALKYPDVSEYIYNAEDVKMDCYIFPKLALTA